MQEYLREVARSSSDEFSAEKVLAVSYRRQACEAVLVHKKKVEKPTLEECWYAYANMQRQTSSVYRTVSEEESACYLCGCAISHSCPYDGGACCHNSDISWTIDQVVPNLDRHEIWNYRLVCFECCANEVSLYHAALSNGEDSSTSQAVRERITTLTKAVKVYHKTYTGSCD